MQTCLSNKLKVEQASFELQSRREWTCLRRTYSENRLLMKLCVFKPAFVFIRPGRADDLGGIFAARQVRSSCDPPLCHSFCHSWLVGDYHSVVLCWGGRTEKDKRRRGRYSRPDVSVFYIQARSPRKPKPSDWIPGIGHVNVYVMYCCN